MLLLEGVADRGLDGGWETKNERQGMWIFQEHLVGKEMGFDMP